jgi:outer membrane protein insertion porin family
MKASFLGTCFLALPLLATPRTTLATQEKLPSTSEAMRITLRPAGVVRRIEFRGLRRFTAGSLLSRMALREGQALDAGLVERDVRALNDLGWFETVTVQVEPLPLLVAQARDRGLPCGLGPQAWDPRAGSMPSDLAYSAPEEPVLRVVFVLEERPFLAGVDFVGSRALAPEAIGQLLDSRSLAPKLARPANPTELYRAARAIESALVDMGHAAARVAVRLQPVPTESARAIFTINEGPRVPVSQVRFEGNLAFSETKLRGEMHQVTPHVFLAGWRNKNIYTPLRLAEDRMRLEEFYRHHGFPEARVGQPQVTFVEERVRSWFPWPRWKTLPRIRIVLPIYEGMFYRLEAVHVEGPGREDDGLPDSLPRFNPLEPYSEEKMMRARDALARALPAESAGVTAPGHSREDATRPRPEVEVIPRFNPERGTVRVVFRARAGESYLVRRIEFQGHHLFNDRFYRRRILLREGDTFSSELLQKGLARLAASGYIKPVKQENVEIRFDEGKRTVDILIRVEEIGRQRISLLGGGSNLGSTAGVAYSVFNLLRGEELLLGHLEGGRDTVYLITRLAKDGIFGTRASFALSVYRTLVRPRFPGSRTERLYIARSSGLSQTWSYPLTPAHVLAISYEHASTSTTYSQDLIADAVSGEVATYTARRAVAVAWAHRVARARFSALTSVSGGALGGNEEVLRSSIEYVRAQPALTSRRNSWAFRGHLSGVGSYAQRELPLSARLFAGPELVRGLRAGELSPLVATARRSSDGTVAYRAQPAGANLVAGTNLEYRAPLTKGNALEAAAFFDAGAAWLRPRWLGGGVAGSHASGVMRTATGMELRWVLPERILRVPMPLAGQTVRVHYAISPVSIARSLLFPDGTRFQPARRSGVFGWALGSMF